MVGTPGAVALTAKLWVTVDAALKAALPAWSASMVHVPAATKISAPPPETVQTAVVAEVNVTGSPLLAVAVSVGAVPMVWAPGFANVIVWLPRGVTLLLGADGVPVPALFVAVTVKVYDTPLVRPVTTIGLPAPVPVMPPGFDVTV